MGTATKTRQTKATAKAPAKKTPVKKLPAKKMPAKKSGIKKIAEASGVVEYRLANGLKILLRQNKSAPVVSFMIVYRVGSRNEAVGYTGSTHFLEHMMFKGTKKFNPANGTGVMEILAAIGALRNATTSMDRTNYFECAGSEYLELCVQLEADRMRNLNLRQEDRDSEMTVVRNEFERGENSPTSALYKELVSIAFREHPYHHPTIGWRSDVECVPLERMREFYQTYYWPNNATVIAVGDFENDQALALIDKYFGKIPTSPHEIPEVYTVEPPQEGERRLELRRGGDLPQLMIGYHTPEADHADTYALSLASSILGDAGKRSSRLYTALMESGLATSCFSQSSENHDPHLFLLGATLAPEKSFEEVETAIYAELKKLAEEPVSDDELARVKSANRKGTILASADPQSYANMLCAAEAVADWHWLIEYDAKVDAVTAKDIMRVARKYFGKTNRTVGHFIPTEREQQPEPIFQRQNVALKKPASKKEAPAAKTSLASLKLPTPGSKASNFAGRVLREVLPNGLTLLAMNNPGTGSVAISGAIAAGDGLADYDLSLLPTATSTMLTRGSAQYDKHQLAQIFEEMGIRFGFAADRFKVGFSSLVVKEDFSRFVDVLSDLIRHPVFPEQELSQVCREMRAGLTRSMNDTGRRAAVALSQELFGKEHPFYDKSPDERIAELDHLTVGQLQGFHAIHYNPKSTVIAVVGDMQPEEILATFTRCLSDWSGLERKNIVVPIVSLPETARQVEVFLPDKASVDVMIGHPTSLSRQSPDYFAAQLANAALGKDTISSRLGKVLRVKHGLTYGIYSYFDDTSFGGAPWSVDLTVNPTNVQAALELVRKVVSDYVKKGITAEELTAEAGRAVGNFMVSLRSSSGIADTLNRLEYLGLGVEAMDSFAQDFMSVSKKDVNQAISKYFHLDNAVTVLSGSLPGGKE
ncbi:MAG: insulinase family protein [Candidatus Obscuribacterales bacterium]|nr:insulinase family protein [Candidatus Obscuribacterales bacterium]